MRPKPVHGMRSINCVNIVFPEFMAPLPEVQPQQSTRDSVRFVQIATKEYRLEILEIRNPINRYTVLNRTLVFPFLDFAQ